jgi:hypothetical protein
LFFSFFRFPKETQKGRFPPAAPRRSRRRIMNNFKVLRLDTGARATLWSGEE